MRGLKRRSKRVVHSACTTSLLETVFIPLAIACAVLGGLLVASAPANARERVAFDDPRFAPGTIIVRTGERKLYLVTGRGEALRYTVAVGKAGKQWMGTKFVEEMQVEPAWSPPASVKRDKPWIPNLIAGGTPGNPMGARAIGLGPNGQYAIHGTNLPGSVGTAASYGCFRMHNADVIDLYERVRIGTPVVVTR
jgi:lipoprotein-anchoring transpeptidase ErfK/SrfK